MKKSRSTRARKSRKLVLGYLEKVSSKVFEEYPEEIASLVKQHHGVYALYKRSKLYYVGLAIDLGKRLKDHLKDKHSGKWDWFSLFLIRNSDHIHEIESLLLRIASPNGNTLRGSLKQAVNMRPELKHAITEANKRTVSKLLDTVPKPSKKMRNPAARKTRRVIKNRSKLIPLAGLVTKRTPICRDYKGITYKATVRLDGRIRYRGKVYMSPSEAAKSITNRATNGWGFWRFKNNDGEWVKLKELRR